MLHKANTFSNGTVIIVLQALQSCALYMISMNPYIGKFGNLTGFHSDSHILKNLAESNANNFISGSYVYIEYITM